MDSYFKSGGKAIHRIKEVLDYFSEEGAMLQIFLVVLLLVGLPLSAQSQEQPIDDARVFEDWLGKGFSFFLSEEASYWSIGRGTVDKDAEREALDRFAKANLDFDSCRALCSKSFSLNELTPKEKAEFKQCNGVMLCVSRPPDYWATRPSDERPDGLING